MNKASSFFPLYPEEFIQTTNYLSLSCGSNIKSWKLAATDSLLLNSFQYYSAFDSVVHNQHSSIDY